MFFYLQNYQSWNGLKPKKFLGRVWTIVDKNDKTKLLSWISGGHFPDPASCSSRNVKTSYSSFYRGTIYSHCPISLLVWKKSFGFILDMSWWSGQCKFLKSTILFPFPNNIFQQPTILQKLSYYYIPEICIIGK